MTDYLVYGLAVACALDLPLPRAARAADVAVERLAGGPVADRSVAWLAGGEQPQGPWRSGLTGDQRFVLSYGDGVAHFVLDGDGSRVAWWDDGLPPGLLSHLLVDHVLPQVAMRRGRLVLHAACLGTPDGAAFGVAGESGRGKSTLAAALMADGHALLSDDCAVIDVDAGTGPSVAPAYPGLRLHPASLPLVADAGLRADGAVAETGAKLRLSPAGPGPWPGATPIPLRALMMLAPPGAAAPAPRRLGAGEALVAVLRQSFHLGVASDRPGLIDRATALIAAVPVTEVGYHHSPAGLAETVAVIARLVRSGAGRQSGEVT